MSKEALVATVKQIIALSKEGKSDQAYSAYRDLFADPAFMKHRPEDQRQALKLMVLAKGAPSKPTQPMIDAHTAAIPPLTELVSVHNEPADFEMLGMCRVLLGQEEAAMAVFKAGLQIERERSPGSDLCGALMRRVSLL